MNKRRKEGKDGGREGKKRYFLSLKLRFHRVNYKYFKDGD